MPDSLTITREWFELLDALPDDSFRRVIRAVASFAFDGTKPEKDELSGVEKSVFMTIRGKLLRQRRNARFYNKHKSEASYSDAKSVLIRRLNKTEKASYSDDLQLFPETSNQHSITNISPNCIDKSIHTSPTGKNSTARRVFKVPTLEEVRDYISGKGYSVDPEEFFSFYESQGWHVGKNKMRDWHRAVSYWQCRINNKNKTRAQLRDYSGI